MENGGAKMHVGVDGCKRGWFFFQFGEGEPSFGVVPLLSDLLKELPDNSVVLVDIPIGLREANEGGRLCDFDARKALAPKRSSSVFPAPCRQAVYASSYTDGSAVNKRILDKKLSKQSWAIAPKIREVDELLQRSDGARLMVREVHPEVCFWGLTGAPMDLSKKTREGFTERLDVLSTHLPDAREIAAAAFLEHGGYETARDDILDALVAAYCALRVADCRTIPGEPEIDPTGLPMEMVYLPHGAL